MKFSVAFILFACLILAGCAASVLGPQAVPQQSSADKARALIIAVSELSDEGLEATRYDFSPLQEAIRVGAADRIETEAQALFLKAATDVNAGVIVPADRTSWRMKALEPDLIAINAAAEAAFRNGDFKAELSALAPSHEQYQRLKMALAQTPSWEADKRAAIALNMERWRWMPRALGEDYIFVNAPAFELIAYRDSRVIDRRRVIVGSRTLPTLQISAVATGVAFNPTWYVPTSIVAESIGALMKNDPDRAAALGYYVAADGGVRQGPGPANALGQVKLIMPNPYSVFLHDTPGKAAFSKDMRALSHGCIRVSGAVDFAKIVLGDAVSDDEVAKILAATTPREIDFEKPLPVYVGYFTAFVEDDGTLTFYRDIYGLDAPLLPRFGGSESAGAETHCCGSSELAQIIGAKPVHSTSSPYGS